MGRKAKPGTSPIYGSYLVSLLYRLPEVMGSQAQEPPQHAGETIEKALQSTFAIPEIKQQAPIMLERIKSMSSLEWKETVLKYIAFWSDLLSSAFTQRGTADPLKDLSLDKKAKFIIVNMGWQGSIAEVAVDLRGTITDLLEHVASGDTKELQQQLSDTTRGLFTEELDKSVSIIELSLLAFGGDDLVNEVDHAVRILRKRLHSSTEFMAAVELVEDKQEWGGLLTDQRFREAWDNLRPKVMGRIRSKDLKIPGLHEVDWRGRTTWDEEESLAMRTIFIDFVKRASEKPGKLIEDAWKGKLARSLVIAVEDKVKDAIKYEKAKERDVRKRVSIDEDEGEHKTKVQVASTEESPLDQMIKTEGWNELVAKLEESEKTVLTLLFGEGLPQKEVARILGRSQTWVSIKRKSLLKKLEKLRPKSDNR